MTDFALSINGERRTLSVDETTPLLWVLREELKLTGTKYGCGIGACGACTVHVAGTAVRSCLLPVSLIRERPVTTIEAMHSDRVGKVVQAAWIENDVVQCGYCQSGQIMGAVALLKANPKPSDSDIEQSLGGNICRCGTYVRIRTAVKHAADRLA